MFNMFALPNRVEINKIGGIRKWYQPWKITYNKLHQDPCVSDSDGQPIVRLSCEGGGNEKCKFMGFAGESITIKGKEYSEIKIFKICNKIITKVDAKIKAGNTKGSVSKKVKLTPLNGSNAVSIHFSASWENANTKTGDVNYFIEFDEV